MVFIYNDIVFKVKPAELSKYIRYILQEFIVGTDNLLRLLFKESTFKENNMIGDIIRRISMIIVLVLMVITGALWLASKPGAHFNGQQKYCLIVFDKNKEKIDAVSKIVKEKDLNFITNTAPRISEVESGFRVVQYLPSEEAAKNMADFLTDKELKSEAKLDSESNRFYVQVLGSFTDKKKAEATAEKAFNIVRTIFEVETNYKQFPYTAYQIIITDFPDEESAELLKEELSLKADNFEIVFQQDIIEELTETDTGIEEKKESEEEKKEAGQEDME